MVVYRHVRKEESVCGKPGANVLLWDDREGKRSDVSEPCVDKADKINKACHP